MTQLVSRCNPSKNLSSLVSGISKREWKEDSLEWDIEKKIELIGIMIERVYNLWRKRGQDVLLISTHKEEKRIIRIIRDSHEIGVTEKE